jgi:hypothetical protein
MALSPNPKQFASSVFCPARSNACGNISPTRRSVECGWLQARWSRASAPNSSFGSITRAFRPTPRSPPEKFKKYVGGVTSHHRVTRYEPPRFLSTTWGDEKDPSEVSFELTTEGDKVRLILVRRRLPNRTEMISVGGGWHTHLAVLNERLNGRIPPSFWTLFGDIEDQHAKRIAPYC